mmetsp:Transcript_1100/g.3649  ORF Transcript_1100/g.3649 Transcript_1100/m.3649 type:complete len:91 (-) Transcript_1100:115-387(-)|eukprot:scaffold13468_cov35-Tisochrysis_lutea.AAC.2
MAFVSGDGKRLSPEELSHCTLYSPLACELASLCADVAVPVDARCLAMATEACAHKRVPGLHPAASCAALRVLAVTQYGFIDISEPFSFPF